ncbi:hypothetical protein MVEN_01596100 [Mycena venus]|uniref:DUF6534 domain-containing protein n=1 Tax=Mycena venus TaxID=2733690 RepID=A0A8H6XST2_9AGAR|nr:hypothetical protein MVEN_01596100 [Mycena venus]
MSSPSSVPDPAVVAAAVAQVKEVFATSFIGFAIATTAYGISVLQCYLYFRQYPRDSMYLKMTVGTLLLLDTLSTIMTAHALYTYFVLNFGNISSDALIPWHENSTLILPTVRLILGFRSFALTNGLLTMVTITAQCFYAWQIWTVSFNVFVTVGILLSAFAAFGLGLYVTVHLFRFPAVATLATPSVQAVTGPFIGLAACCDIAITAALIFYLYSKRREGELTTKDMIDSLIRYALCRGILTAITQIIFLALNVGIPDRTLWQPFHQLVGKLYVNSIVASLNVRNVVRGKGDPERSGRVVSRSTAATESTRAVPLSFIVPKTDTTGTFDVETHDHNYQNQGHEDNKAEIMTSTV